ncbi:very short patch repair endonuclease [uncultured Methanoregula sp.]|uniref:very short patch repair endonuclease n=1 Tax=uncultured Methanoregula sp. TaxID=1005933 RepID=UPI002AABF261|nr:very short patch repair endonuclease [uncultured Methanoregula sp.]
MVDVLTPDQRAYNMSRIRGKNTGPEIKFRKLLWSAGIKGYRIHYSLLGKPDIVFIKKKIVIFIDGCFWHKCPVCFKEPETRTEFWMKKIQSNIDRDKKINAQLEKDGWTVIRVWEHEIKKNSSAVIKSIKEKMEESQ